MSVILTSTVDSSDVLTLHNPKFGDVNTINFKRINRQSRGNDLILSGESGWLPSELIKFEWDYLCRDDRDRLKYFMERHVGIPVQVVDHYGVTRTVVFLRPDAELAQVGRENRSVTLDMQIVS